MPAISRSSRVPSAATRRPSSSFCSTAARTNLGPYPSKGKNGSSYTISQALRYKKSATEEATARFVFNIHLTADKRTAELSAVEYDDPTGVKEVRNMKPAVRSDVYNLQGHKVATPTAHGIYIMSGNKVVL